MMLDVLAGLGLMFIGYFFIMGLVALSEKIWGKGSNQQVDPELMRELSRPYHSTFKEEYNRRETQNILRQIRDGESFGSSIKKD